MSKEQTPIEVRALEFCEKHAHKLNAVDSYNLRSMLVDFANSEVLEALEREFKKIDVQYYESGFGNKEQGGKYYYETEVKPNYVKSI